MFIHIADPAEFFKPIDYNNERWLELALYRDRRYQDRSRFPDFEELMAERDRLFAKHPRTTLILAHIGWHANDLARVGRMFDANPNLYTEVGAVLYDIGRQPRAAHDFFVKYQDRLLFGKDSYQPDEYPYYWRVFETNDEYFDYYRDYHAFWKLYGIGLPDPVLKKLYYQNALKIIPGPAARRLSHELNPWSHVSRHRRRRLHRLASVGRTRPPRPPRARARQSDHRQAPQPRSHPRRRVHRGRPGGSRRRASARSKGIDYVLHQAAIPSVPRSVQDPVTSNRANIDGSLNMLVAARDAGVKRLVYAGSSSAYGDTPTLPKREDMPTESAVAVRAAEAGRRTVLPDVHAALRLRDRDDPLLQRLRSAPGSRVAVFGRHFAVCDGAPGRPPADDLRRRRADARLHLRRERRRRRAARVRGAAGGGRGDQRRDRRAHFAERAARAR